MKKTQCNVKKQQKKKTKQKQNQPIFPQNALIKED